MFTTGDVKYSYNNQQDGWLLCNGAEYTTAEYPALAAQLGAVGGTFLVPDAHGRVLIGAGQGVNLTMRELGDTGGQETVVLNESEMPLHSHRLRVADQPGADQVPPSEAFLTRGTHNRSTGEYEERHFSTERTGSFIDIHSDTISSTGGDEDGVTIAHDNMQPFLAVYTLIKT